MCLHPNKSISPSTMMRNWLNRGTKNSHEMDWNSCALCQSYNLTRPIWLLASLILVTLTHPQCQRMIMSKNPWVKSHSSVSNYPKPLAKPRFPAKRKLSLFECNDMYSSLQPDSRPQCQPMELSPAWKVSFQSCTYPPHFSWSPDYGYEGIFLSPVACLHLCQPCVVELLQAMQRV